MLPFTERQLWYGKQSKKFGNSRLDATKKFTTFVAVSTVHSVMKRIYFYTFTLFLTAGLTACMRNYDRTIINLKTAIDREITAQSQYAAFAIRAEQDSLYPIDALFKAASQAKEISVNNLRTALTDLDINDYHPEKQLFTIQSTVENLQSSIDNEKDKSQNMYPAFIEDARKEKAQKAVNIFKQAQETGKSNTNICSYIIGNIKSPAVLAAVYYVCPECGNLFLGTTANQCDICGTSAKEFIRSSASATLQDATTGASMRVNN